ncbi:hypothetical protein ACIGGF_19955 [Rhodococcus sp. NPDC078407]|uniref:bestrophin-like domain n=1 Tax=Rhodococcus sp. NPDC078407 TaxID=3364509 RepID=UPI0037CBC88F
MSSWILGLIVVLVVVVAVTAKLAARTRAPDPGWFIDSTRAAGALTVIGTMFSVLLAFTIFFALQSYQRASNGASVEAVAVTELHNVADVLEGHDGERLHGGLICYSRAVVADEWPAMTRSETSPAVNHWVDTMAEGFAATTPEGASQEAAYSQWFDQQAERRDAAAIGWPKRHRRFLFHCGSFWESERRQFSRTCAYRRIAANPPWYKPFRSHSCQRSWLPPWLWSHFSTTPTRIGRAVSNPPR